MNPAADQNLCGYLVSETPTKRRPWASNARDAEAAAERPFFFLHFLAATALRALLLLLALLGRRRRAQRLLRLSAAPPLGQLRPMSRLVTGGGMFSTPVLAVAHRALEAATL